jgi:hypothetical protein
MAMGALLAEGEPCPKRCEEPCPKYAVADMSFAAGWLRRLLFVQAPENPSSHIRGTSDEVILTVLFQRDPGCSRRRMGRVLEAEIAPRVKARMSEWGARSCRRFAPPSFERPVVFFMEATRKYRTTATLCQLEGEAPPLPFDLPVTPLYDAILEFRFSASPGTAALDGIRQALVEPGVFQSVVLVGSRHQVEVYDSGSVADERSRVNICFLIRRPPGMSREACQQYWSHQHAQLALDNMKYLGLTRYRQVHTVPTSPPGLDDMYDGVVYAEKASMSKLVRDLLKINTARFNDTVVVDESHFTHATPVMLMCLQDSYGLPEPAPRTQAAEPALDVLKAENPCALLLLARRSQTRQARWSEAEPR